MRFHYQSTKNQKVMIYSHGRLAMTLTGQRALEFLGEVEGLEDEDAQYVMAVITGQFKFGNERMARQHPRYNG